MVAVEIPDYHTFRRSIAVVIGIDAYANGVPPLGSAANDARRLAQLLAVTHGYEVRLLLDGAATRDRILALLQAELPAEVDGEDRVLFYFAGHGVALEGEEGSARGSGVSGASGVDAAACSVAAVGCGFWRRHSHRGGARRSAVRSSQLVVVLVGSR